MKELKKKISIFQKNILFNSDYEYLGILSCFVDRKDAKNRIIIVIKDVTSLKKVEKISSSIFTEVVVKIIVKKDSPKATFIAESGNGIRNINTMHFGTLGGFLTRKNSGNKLYGVSNNHVIARLNNAQQHEEIIYAPNVKLGRLVNYIRLKKPPKSNNADAAIFELKNGVIADWNPTRPVGRSVGPKLRTRVYKQGYKTNYTEGVITGVNGSIKVLFGNQEYFFHEVISIRGIHEPFNDFGDSGSFILTLKHHLVGMVFAKHGDYCLALPIGALSVLR